MIVLIVFIFINYYHKDQGFRSFSDEPQVVIEETSHLAPHGVPANPIPRVSSKQNLGDEKGNSRQNQKLGDDYYKNEENLNIPNYDGKPF